MVRGIMLLAACLSAATCLAAAPAITASKEQTEILKAIRDARAVVARVQSAIDRGEIVPVSKAVRLSGAAADSECIGILIPSGDGRWLIQVTRSGGNLVAKEVPVFPVGPTPTPEPKPKPVPDPKPTPIPDELTARSKAIRDAALKATGDAKRTETATQLAELFRQVALKIQDGGIKGQEMTQFAVKLCWDNLLPGKGSAVVMAWKPVRELMGNQMASVINSGGTDAEFVKLLNETAAGLQASAPNAQPQIDMEMIFAIIKLIMELIALLS